MPAVDTAFHRSETKTYKVRMSGALMQALVAMAGEVKGAKVDLDWGQPDEEGFYTPTLTVTNPVEQKRYGDPA